MKRVIPILLLHLTATAWAQPPPQRAITVPADPTYTLGVLASLPDPLQLTITSPPWLAGKYSLAYIPTPLRVPAGSSTSWGAREWSGSVGGKTLRLALTYAPTGMGSSGAYVLTVWTASSQETLRGRYRTPGGPLTFFSPGGIVATSP